MFKKFCVSPFIIMLAIVTSAILTPVQAHDQFTKTNDKGIEEALPGENGKHMDGSVDADVHGDITNQFRGDPVDFHLHGFAYLHTSRKGNYTFAGEITLTAEGKKKWKGESPEAKDSAMGQSLEGFYREFKLEKSVPTIHANAPGGEVWWNSYVDWQISATSNDTSTGGVATVFMKNGVLDAAPDNNGGDGGEENDNWEDAQGDAELNRDLGISVADSEQTPQPGDSVTLDIATPEPYYDITLYVKRPWDTSERGTYQDYTYGGGTSTQTSFSYTFPTSGSTDATGDFLFTAVIYRWSDMSSYEETYTLSVSGSSSSAASDPPPYNADCTLCTLYSTQGCSQCQ